MSDPILRLDTVSKIYAQADRQVTALSPTSLQVAEGDFVCLLGPSGCGKSTMLRMVAGFEAPTSGAILFQGRDVREPGPERGMVFQDYALFPWLTVRENVAFGPLACGSTRRDATQTANRYLEMVGLTQFAEAWPHQLSGGMRQRVAIARVLANHAKVLLMDEPFGALDAMTREHLQTELLAIHRRTGVTVMFVTHSIEEAVMLGSRIIVMSPGPGRIVSDQQIPLSFPRDPTGQQFNDIRRALTATLHTHPQEVGTPVPASSDQRKGEAS